MKLVKEKKLDQFLGNFIIKEYKKEDPSQQSFWVTDVSRLTCVIRKAIEDKNEWYKDKKAYELPRYIISPILDFVIEIMAEKIIKSNEIVDKTVNGAYSTDGSNKKVKLKRYLGKTWEEADSDRAIAADIKSDIEKREKWYKNRILNHIKSGFSADRARLLIENRK